MLPSSSERNLRPLHEGSASHVAMPRQAYQASLLYWNAISPRYTSPEEQQQLAQPSSRPRKKTQTCSLPPVPSPQPLARQRTFMSIRAGKMQTGIPSVIFCFCEPSFAIFCDKGLDVVEVRLVSVSRAQQQLGEVVRRRCGQRGWGHRWWERGSEDGGSKREAGLCPGSKTVNSFCNMTLCSLCSACDLLSPTFNLSGVPCLDPTSSGIESSSSASPSEVTPT
jgi:hypothetical protein